MQLLDILNSLMPAMWMAKIFITIFLAILFLQSGLDKLFNWQGNLDWLKGHFAKTFLKSSVTMMLGVVMITEIVAGTLCGIGLIEILLYKTVNFSLLGIEFSALNVVMLFFGQRIAQDYEGAATLTTYFVLIIIGIVLLS